MLTIILEVLGGIAVAGLLLLVALAVRRWFIQRGGTFDCSLRIVRKRFGRGWALGMGRYSGSSIEWFRAFSLSVRPKRVLARDRLRIVNRREPEYPETLALMSGHVVLECTESGFAVDLAMSPEATTGFIAWLEAGPPGRHVGAA